MEMVTNYSQLIDENMAKLHKNQNIECEWKPIERLKRMFSESIDF